MLNFAICDDNSLVLNRLAKILESIFIEHNLDAKVSYSCLNPDDLLAFISHNQVDVLFLDIDLKHKENGIDLANNIRKTNKDVYIIFTSAHLEYILIAYKCKTFDFIPKPITLERVEETILRLIDDINSDYKKNSFIKINNKNTIINEDCINFIKRDGMKLVFYTDDKTYETYSSFNKISNELPSNFVRCHKSYIANIDNVSNICIADNTIEFNNNSSSDKCYIGPKYKNKIMEVLDNEYFSNNMDCTNDRK